MLPIQRCLLLTLIFHTGLEQPFSLNTVYGVHLGTEMDGMMCLCSSNRITLCITCVVPGLHVHVCICTSLALHPLQL